MSAIDFLRLRELRVNEKGYVFANGYSIGYIYKYSERSMKEGWGCYYQFPYLHNVTGIIADHIHASFPMHKECLEWIEKQHIEFLVSFFREEDKTSSD